MMEKPQRPKRRDFSKGALGDMSYDQATRQWQADMNDWRRFQRSSGGSGRSSWTPASSQNPDVGIIAGTDHTVSFKTSGDETLIADGDYSEGDGTSAKAARKGFDGTRRNRGHDHHGSGDRQSRGKYTGPDH